MARELPTASERIVDAGEVRLRIFEQGRGPAVVLCHGFPGLAHSWHKQVPMLAANGYRAIAVDMRGYGGSDRPPNPEQYSRAHTAGDMAGLLDALGLDAAIFAGQDFGAGLTWDLPQWAPGRVRALIQISVPRMPTAPTRPTEAFAKIAAEHFLHIHYFQEPGVADAELDKDPFAFLSAVYWALSGGYHYADIWQHPSEGNGYVDVLPKAPPLPWPWMTKEDFAVFVDTFTESGFTGGLNWYRASDVVWLEKQERPDEPVTVPTVFIAGARDSVLEPTYVGNDPLATTRASVPGLVGAHIIPEAGHFVQMEAADQVNRIILDFLGKLSPTHT